MSFNILAILLAAASSMVVGTLWFLPATFGNAWNTITGVDAMKPQRPAVVFPLSFLSAAITATVLSGAASLVAGMPGWAPLAASLIAAGALWLGFTAATTAVHYLFEGRSLRLYTINVGHLLVTALVMGLIVGLFGF